MIGRFRGPALGIAAGILAGCAVGPDYQRPSTSAPAAYRENAPWKQAAPRDAMPKSSWWSIFDDPNLDRLERDAVAANPDLRAALDRVDEARATARIDRAAFYPALSLDPTPSRTRYSGNREAQTDSPVLAYTTNSFDLPIDLNYELDLFGRVRRAYESARAEAEAQAADFQNVLLSLEAEVAQDYFTSRALAAEQSLLDQTVQFRKDALDLVDKRRVGGASSDLDVAQAEAELATVQSEALAVAQSRAELAHALAVLTGCEPESFSLDPTPLHGDPPAIPAGLPSELLERRPDVGQAEREMAAASARIGVAKAAFFPRIDLTAYAGLNSAALNTLFHSNSEEWTVAPLISLPLFEGGRNRADYERAKSAYDEAAATYRSRVLTAFRDVEDGLSDLRYLAAQDEALGRAADAARRAADLSNLRYREGATDYFEVIDAERTALEAEREAVELRGRRFAASVFLVKALGGGWENSSRGGP
jgi:multidrug efflux system outer membrane protein